MQTRIMDDWGAVKGFSTYTDDREEDEDCAEDKTAENRPPQSSSSLQVASGKK